MNAGAIVRMIPNEKLDFLSAQTNVDYKVHKLKGNILFKLILYSLITTRNSSLRVLESVFKSYRFKTLAGIEKNTTTRFTSIRDRITTIEPLYFEQLFEHCTELFSKQLDVGNSRVLRYDSTMVAISARLLSMGMKVGSKGDKKHIKCTIGYNGLLPTSAKVFTEQKHLNEDTCLYESILKAGYSKDDIVVFDRGIQRRATYKDFTDRSIRFVTRIKTSSNYELIADNVSNTQTALPHSTESLVIESDQMVYLFIDKKQKADCKLRLIKAKMIKDGEPICFLTNIETSELDTIQVTETYRARWDIEVFFKFLKQELDLNHITVRTVNGLKVMLYMKLIASILLTAYRELNKLKGYKLVKMQFANELEEDLIKEVVLICGGDPGKMYGSS